MGDFTQDDGYMQGVAPMHYARPPRILLELLLSSVCKNPNSSLMGGGGCLLNEQRRYNRVLDTDTGTGPIPPVTVSRVNAYSGGALARALPEGLRYLST
jgi:hypothetical protein